MQSKGNGPPHYITSIPWPHASFTFDPYQRPEKVVQDCSNDFSKLCFAVFLDTYIRLVDTFDSTLNEQKINLWFCKIKNIEADQAKTSKKRRNHTFVIYFAYKSIRKTRKMVDSLQYIDVLNVLF